MKQARFLPQIANRFQQAQRSHADGFAGGLGFFKALPHLALAGEVVDFVGRGRGQNAAQRGGVANIALVQEEAAVVNGGIVQQAVQPGAVQISGRTRQAVNVITFFQQKFGEVGAVLAGDAGDERAGHGS